MTNRASRTSGRLFALALGCGLALTACGTQGSYTWVQNLPPTQTADEYAIAPGDMLSVRVYNQDNMSTHARVRSDGKLAMPFLGDVEVRGKTPAVLSKELEARLKEYVVSPSVTVTVEETRPTSVAVLGEVTHPGNYTLDPTSGVLEALAASGGFSDYASRSSIFVVRRTPAERVRFDYEALASGEQRACSFRLRAGDVVVVE
jgi:polysaccharide export outer membrane protein